MKTPADALETRTPDRASLLAGRARCWKGALLALAGLAAPLASSCRLAQTAVEMPGKLLGGSGKAPAVPASVLQTGVMRFADTFASQVTQAAQDFAQQAGTPAARIQAMNWTVGQCTAAFTIATGANPSASMLDMVVLVTLGRALHEEHWLQVWGEADRVMLTTFVKLEQEIWEVAGQLLSPEQQEAVRATLDDWRARNPEVGLTAFVKLPAFQDLLAAAGGESKGVFGELSSLVSLDPLSGLEPTTREIEQTRLFAERTLFYLQRVPLILPIQVELLGLKLTELPAVGSALDDSARISHAATSLAETAAALPEAVRVEREAAVRQVAEELTLQRQGLLHDLETAQAPAQQLLSETRTTLAAGTEMTVALQELVRVVDGFLASFEEPAAPGAEPPAPEPDEEPGRPFDIRDYGDAATRVGTAAGELTKLVATLEHSLPEAERLLDEVALRGERTLDRAFARGLALGATLIALAALAVLLVRWLSARRVSAGAPESRRG